MCDKAAQSLTDPQCQARMLLLHLNSGFWPDKLNVTCKCSFLLIGVMTLSQSDCLQGHRWAQGCLLFNNESC